MPQMLSNGKSPTGALELCWSLLGANSLLEGSGAETRGGSGDEKDEKVGPYCVF